MQRISKTQGGTRMPQCPISSDATGRGKEYTNRSLVLVECGPTFFGYVFHVARILSTPALWNVTGQPLSLTRSIYTHAGICSTLSHWVWGFTAGQCLELFLRCHMIRAHSFPRQNLTNSAANLVNSAVTAARQMKFRGSPRLHS